jgi:hypothetical protein
VPARDVGAHGHRHEQGEGVRDGRRDQPDRGVRAAAQLGCTRTNPRLVRYWISEASA